MTADSRRRQILDAAKQCFAHGGFAGTTTKKVAAAAEISEGLLFRHFPTKAALHAEILAETCASDPALKYLLGLKPSTETLIIFVRDIVRHFMSVSSSSDRAETEKYRLNISSHLDDGEFSRLLFEKIEALIAPVFAASLEQAIANGDAVKLETDSHDLFWFAHHLLHTLALTRLPARPSLKHPPDKILERHLCDFILRGIGVSGRAIALHLDKQLIQPHSHELIAESA